MFFFSMFHVCRRRYTISVRVMLIIIGIFKKIYERGVYVKQINMSPILISGAYQPPFKRFKHTLRLSIAIYSSKLVSKL